ncbi:unnamed protein product [Nyctereutes procyonoides]|uniref:(raccoon dog) hypothetical protein n=1 Tax=Nyctereutes procyonoides TaxID=34880 RepID=A0A811Y5A0_NYCPR|nr:unnamed protein product [Nyctereutes procyonoides]
MKDLDWCQQDQGDSQSCFSLTARLTTACDAYFVVQMKQKEK